MDVQLIRGDNQAGSGFSNLAAYYWIQAYQDNVASLHIHQGLPLPLRFIETRRHFTVQQNIFLSIMSKFSGFSPTGSRFCQWPDNYLPFPCADLHLIIKARFL